MSVEAGWRPLVSGATRQEALQAVDAIAESVTSLSPGERDPSLAGGQAGLALLYAGLAKEGRSPQAHDLAWECLDRAIESVATGSMGSSLWEGFTGIAWAANLVERLLEDGGEDGN